MSGVTRDQVSTALLNQLLKASFITLLSNGQAINFVTSGKRFRPWDEVQGAAQPAIFLTKPKEKHVRQDLRTPAIRTLQFEAFIYINDGSNKAATVTPMTSLDNIADAIDPRTNGVLAPEVISNRQTLGGLIYDCYIEGEIIMVPGDMNGQGVMVIPILVIMP